MIIDMLCEVLIGNIMYNLWMLKTVDSVIVYLCSLLLAQTFLFPSLRLIFLSL